MKSPGDSTTQLVGFLINEYLFVITVWWFLMPSSREIRVHRSAGIPDTAVVLAVL